VHGEGGAGEVVQGKWCTARMAEGEVVYGKGGAGEVVQGRWCTVAEGEVVYGKGGGGSVVQWFGGSVPCPLRSARSCVQSLEPGHSVRQSKSFRDCGTNN